MASLLLLVVYCGSAAAVAIPQAIADEFGAKCANGEPPAYYISRNVHTDKWVLFLEGGGWKFPTKISARESLEGGPFYSPTSADIGGIMGADPALNPDFYTWNRVFMHYCDGTSMGSSRTEPITVQNRDGTRRQIWWRGRNCFNAVIATIQRTEGFKNMSEVILVGGSAGGLAVFYNLDHLATLLPNTVRLTGFPGAGFFLDEANTAGDHAYRELFQAADPIWNITGSGGTNLKCLDANKGADAWKCLMAPYIAQYIQTPIYVMNSAYDAWQLTNILNASCIPKFGDPPCDAATNASIQAYRDSFLKAIAVVTDGKPQNGVYVDSCYVHEQNVAYCSNQRRMPNCVGWTPASNASKRWGYRTAVTPPGGGAALTPQQAFSDYYLRQQHSVLVDQSRFPDNPSCQYKGMLPPPSPPGPGPTPGPTPDAPAHPCKDYGSTAPAGYDCRAGFCSGRGGHCGKPILSTLLNPENRSTGCSFAAPSVVRLAACAKAAAVACDAQKGCDSFAIDPSIHQAAPTAMLFVDDGHSLTPNAVWNVWVRTQVSGERRVGAENRS